MATLRQTHFSSGELSPQLSTRTDLPYFSGGMRRIENFFVTKSGSLLSRPGTRYIATAAADTVRLIPFIYSDAVSYVCEFTAGLIRFYQNGAQVKIGSTPVSVVTTYAAEHLFELQYAQSGDVLIITHESYPAMELKRTSTAPAFTLTELSYSAGSAFYVNADDQLELASEWFITRYTADGYSGPDYFESDSNHPRQNWKWKVSTILQHPTTGAIHETLARDVEWYLTGGYPIGGETDFAELGTIQIAVYQDMAVTLQNATGTIPPITEIEYPSVPAEYYYGFVKQYVFYRGRGDVFGFVGTVDASVGSSLSNIAGEFTDEGITPDYALPPLYGTNPFIIEATSGEIVEYPSSVCFFQDRLVLGATTRRPSTVWMSAVGNYKNFDTPYISSESQSLEYALQARKRQKIRSMVPLQKIIIFTDSCIWTMSGTEVAPKLSPTSVEMQVVEEIGSSYMSPIYVGGVAFYSRTKGRGIRGIMHSPDYYGRFMGADFSAHASHLFEGSEGGLVDWTWQEDPFGVIWAVREDGTLLSFTYSPETKVSAYARHETQGEVKSVCAVPEGTEDSLYLAVYRVTPSGPHTFIEKMSSRIDYETTDDRMCLDCAIRRNMTPSATVTGLSTLNGYSVYATTRDGPVYGPLTVSGGSVTLPETPEANEDDGTLTIYVGLKYTPEIETLDVVSSETRLSLKSILSAGVEVTETRGLEVGPDEDNLIPWRQRAVSHSYGAVGPETVLVQVPLNSSWNEFGRLVVRQSNPLPIGITGLVREVEVGK